MPYTLLNPPQNSFIRTIHVPFEWAQIPDAVTFTILSPFIILGFFSSL